ncbi:endonuclease/exonuclease/phosphatase family protein [Luteolibacter soli]|uniref:Endonuclease/exonuclease/phosphatase family protein n=1 Tax=Luteolibacter soli TaxID=3135280 RepID=A0ABU9AS61_9BACT
MRKTLPLLLALTIPAAAVEIRVATYNIGAHFTAEGFPDYSLGDPGTADHDNVRDVLDRIDADVVALQEIASADVSGAPDDLDALAASLGYPYIYTAPTASAPPLTGPIDTTLRVVFLSRFPFITTSAVRSPEGARELTRLDPVVKVDVPGTTRDLLLISAHLKSGTAAADKFRRAVEFKRLAGHLGALGLTNDDNYIIMGDFNLSSSNATYNAFPADMPASYDLGDDIPFPLTYSTNPLSYFTTPSVTKLDLRQVNGSTATFQSGSAIDLIMVSPAIAGRPVDSEVYNSTLDTSNSVGLPKAGSPLAAGASAAASDHYAVFADLELDSDSPNLDLTLSPSTLNEGQPDGAATLTVTLPATRASAVTVALSSDDPGATPVSPTIIIPAGSLSGSTGVHAPRNFITDPQRSITFTATASAYDPDSAVLQLNDVDGPYIIASAGQPVTEKFTTFDGTHDPAPWTTSGGLTWRGSDSGTSITSGLRSYGSGTDGSLGILPNGTGTGTGTTATATFVNQSGAPLTGLQIGFDVEQWRAALNGAADSLSASVFFDGQTFPLPGLSHVASQSQPTGPITGGLTTAKSASLSGLSIPADASFELRVAFTPGAGSGALPSDVFVNEFHYDNASTDTGEFVEIAVGPGYSGALSGISLVLYNGTGGVTYATHTLDTFTLGTTTASGHRLFSKLISGIQNDIDGMAVVAGGTVQEFISYEGSFAATNGPASGMTSTNIGVSQVGTETAGQSALGRTGTGGNRADFTWQKFTGVAHSPGQPNQGQSFVLPTLPSQGLAIDNLSVTGISDGDFDGDGIANSLDPDDDNDGQSDADELAFGTNPFNASSIFRPILSHSGGLTLSFPGANGITYTVEKSTNLTAWSTLSTHPGAGQTIAVTLPTADPAMFFRVKVGP